MNDETVYTSTDTASCSVMWEVLGLAFWERTRIFNMLAVSHSLSPQLVKFCWVRQWHHCAFLHFHHPVHLGGLLRKSQLMLCGMALHPRLEGVGASGCPWSDPQEPSAAAAVVPNMMWMMNPIHGPGVHPRVKQIQIDCPLYFYSSCLFIHVCFHTIT